MSATKGIQDTPPPSPLTLSPIELAALRGLDAQGVLYQQRLTEERRTIVRAIEGRLGLSEGAIDTAYSFAGDRLVPVAMTEEPTAPHAEAPAVA